MAKRYYQDTWKALRDTGACELKLLDTSAQARIVRGVSKEKNADPFKPITKKIFVEVIKRADATYLRLTLQEVIKTRYTVPL